jgi:hypothetical protein
MTRALSPRAVVVLKEKFDEEAELLINRLIEKHEFDAVRDLAEAFPLRVFPDAVGIAGEGREALLAYGSMGCSMRSALTTRCEGERSPTLHRLSPGLSGIAPAARFLPMDLQHPSTPPRKPGNSRSRRVGGWLTRCAGYQGLVRRMEWVPYAALPSPARFTQPSTMRAYCRVERWGCHAGDWERESHLLGHGLRSSSELPRASLRQSQIGQVCPPCSTIA